MSLRFYPVAPRMPDGALLVYTGTAERRVKWSLSGPGTLTPLSLATDAVGVAVCRFTPAGAGDVVTVTVRAGA